MNEAARFQSPPPQISVVVPVFNREKTIATAVGSALNQDVSEIEVICIDDASTDGSSAVLEELVLHDSRVRVITFSENRGTSYARKTGILAAQGEYILCLDADDRFLPGVFGRLLAMMRRKGVDVLQFRCNVIPVGGFSSRIARFFRKLLDSQLPARRAGDWRLLRDQARSQSLRFPSVWNKLYRAEPLQQAARLIEDARMTISEDMLLLVILQSALPSWKSTRFRVVEYRVGEGSISSAQTVVEAFDAKLNRAVCCHALKRYVDAESERLIPGLHGRDGDAVFAAAPQSTQHRVMWLNRLCCALVMDRMEITWLLIPKDADDSLLKVYHRKFLDAFGPDFCQKFFSRVVASLYMRETPPFCLGAQLLWPAVTILSLFAGFLRRIRGYKAPPPSNSPSIRPASPRVAIVTFHTAANYGAALQTYALQRFLLSLGVNAEVLNYFCPYISWCYAPVCFNNNGLHGGSFSKTIAKIRQAFLRHAKNVAFNDFIRRNVALSPRRYYNIAKLSDANERYDVFIAGSDQVFSILCTSLDTTYFLSFVDNPAKKLSYAASFGFDRLPENYKSLYRSLLGSFRHLSLREESGERIVKDLLGPEAPPTAVHPDPTLLLDAAAWNAIAAQSRLRIRRPYLLLYNVNPPKRLFDEAIRLARAMRLRIVYLGQDMQLSARFRSGLRIIDAAAPQDFVRLFQKADCVLTNSFHGTVFSILFRKPFFVELENLAAYNHRAEALVTKLGLEGSILPPVSSTLAVVPSPDWTRVDKILDEQRACAEAYFRDNLPTLRRGDCMGDPSGKEPL